MYHKGLLTGAVIQSLHAVPAVVIDLKINKRSFGEDKLHIFLFCKYLIFSVFVKALMLL